MIAELLLLNLNLMGIIGLLIKIHQVYFKERFK